MNLLRTLMTGIVFWMAFATPALAQADAGDYVLWRKHLGFAPNESLELVYERTNRPLRVQISNAAGQLIASIDLPADPAAGSAGPPSRPKGFGFVTFASESGVLVVDGTRYGALALDMNPRTGRYLIGVTLQGRKTGPGGVPTDASLTVVGLGGETHSRVFVTSYQTSGSSDN